MEEMPRKLPLFVVRERSRHGRVMFYFRRGKDKRIRLPDSYPSQEFDEAYQLAIGGQKVKKRISVASSDSLQWLVDRYAESGKWAGLSIATRRQQGLFFAHIIKNANNPRYKAITKAHIRRAIDDRARTPALANNLLKSLRSLFNWAVKFDYLATNPCDGVDRLKYQSDGFKEWQIEDAVKFCEHWPIGTKPRLAFELFITSGLRRGDVHLAGRQYLKGEIYSMRTAKKGVTITVKFPASLLATIAATPTGDMRFLVKDDGQPFTSKESFGNWFSARCREAGLEVGKSAHGIRKLAATVAAESGATTHELMAHFGWKKIEQAEVYTRGADRKRLGIQSSERVVGQFENVLPRTLIPDAPHRLQHIEKKRQKK